MSSKKASTGLRLTAGTIAILVGAGAAVLLAATTGTPIPTRTPCISNICVEVVASPVEVPWDSSTQITVTVTNVGSEPVEFQLVGHCPIALEITTIDDQPVLRRFPLECIGVPDRLILAPQEAKTATFEWSPRNALPVPPDHPITRRLPAWKDPQGAKARESRLIAAVDGVAQDLVQEYGGRSVSTSAPSGASFSCAMNEAQARGMASDPRVRYVSESGWIELN